MRKLVVIQRSALCLLCLFASLTIYGQQSVQTKRHHYVVVPPENALLVIASQPDCPLQIEDAKLLVSADQSRPPLYQYSLRNRGTKPIQYYIISAWASSGGGGTLSDRSADGLLMPGQTKPPTEQDRSEVVPLTDELRQKLKLQGSMKSVIVLVVEKIRFADGSDYISETAPALRTYFENF